MSGVRSHISRAFDLDRRGFLFRAGLVTGGIMLSGCLRKAQGRKKAYRHIPGKVSGPNEKAGHLLRTGASFPNPITEQRLKTLIVGGGVSGLSAARWLKKQGAEDFMLLELEECAGGNARYGNNKISSYPLGAHYITIANNEDVDLLNFLQEHDVITGFQGGLPVYNDYYLCFDQEERLLINGQWQEGLVPHFGISKEDQVQVGRFFAWMSELRVARGIDGKFAFNIPIDLSSADPLYRDLDQQAFAPYVKKKGFTSSYLFWYLDYCCKDDFGRPAEDVSAWAGINYFAGHRGRAANAETGDVLTWPEGNGRLVDFLRKGLDTYIRPSSMVYDLENVEKGYKVSVIDLKREETYIIFAEKVIMASPQFVNRKILSGVRDFNRSLPQYSPWMVANITLSDMPENRGSGLCWDNVAYGAASVGYVYTGHQHLHQSTGERVITLYLPLCDREPRLSRLAAYARTYDQWLDIVVPELEFMHPGITSLIETIEVWVWGHGMVAPAPGYIFGEGRERSKIPIENNLFFAHTDLSGISLFEEGFYQGIRAAKEVLASL